MPTLFQINVICNSGSTGRIMEEIGEMVQQYGWKSYIAYGRWSNPSSSILYRIGNKLDIWWHVLVTRLFDKHGRASVKSTRNLVNFIKLVKPDIIQLHNLHGYYLNYKILFEYLSSVNIPVVWTLHDCWTMTGHCPHFENIGCKRWKTQCFDCPQKKLYPASLLLDRSTDNYNDKKQCFTSFSNMTIVPVCHWLDSIVHQSYLGKCTTYPIYNGIDINKFRRVDITTNWIKKISQKFIILSIATNWNPTKGGEDIIKLSSILSEDELIIMVGLNKKQIQKLPSNIIGLQRTENMDQLVELYSVANVLLNPTYQDTFPNVNIEALACGIPVITYRTGGSPEAIDDNTGFVVERGDIRGIFAAIKAIKGKEKEYYWDSCRNRVMSLFKKEDRYQQYIDLYYKLMR